MTREEVMKILEQVPTSKVIEEHRNYSIKCRETFLHGSVEEHTEMAKMLGYIEEYIYDKMTAKI